MPTSAPLLPEMPRELYCDDSLLAVDKPAGLLSYPDGYKTDLPHLTKVLEPQYGKLWCVHRLDKDTSGVVLLARDAQAHRVLNAAFKAREVRKRYLALAWPAPEWGEMSIDVPLRPNADRRHRTHADPNGKPAQTLVRVLQRQGPLALLSCEIRTGVTHQIRAHLYSVGLSICGDDLYRPPQAKLVPSPFNAPRMLLHAWHLGINHPVTAARLYIYAPYMDLFRPYIEISAKAQDALAAESGMHPGQ